MSSERTGSGLRFVPGIESLEDRSLPSGNVQVSVIGGGLSVIGDSLDNHIWIAGAGKNAVVIRPTDGATTINGQTALFVNGIKHGYNIRLNGGDDHLLITGTRSNGGLLVDLGDGNDVMVVSDTGHRGATTILGGGGDDTITLRTAGFRSYVFVDTGAGDDNVIADRVIANPIGLLNPGGSDYFDNRGSLLGRLAVTGFNSGPRPATTPGTFDLSALTSMPATPTVTGATPTPVATITTTASNPTNAASALFTVTFSVDVSFGESGVAVANGAISNFTQVNARTYTFTVTPAADGQVTVTVTAGAARDM